VRLARDGRGWVDVHRVEINKAGKILVVIDNQRRKNASRLSTNGMRPKCRAKKAMESQSAARHTRCLPGVELSGFDELDLMTALDNGRSLEETLS
jgi:hypothetical protein